MMTLRFGLLVSTVVVVVGCGKKDDAKSGLPWTPIGYEKLTASCKKALACCEEVATANGAKSAEDYNLKCSGPAIWSDADCDAVLKGPGFGGKGKPVPDACK
jgi:hypothetical protein